MSFRYGAVGALVLAFAIGGCASPGNGAAAPDGGVTAQEMDPDDLPAWAQNLPEGTPPEDNDYTAQAALLLVQAQSAEADEEEAEARQYYQQALQQAQAGIEAHPENAQSYLQAGQAHLALGNIEEGAARLDRAEELYPRYAIETEFFRERAWAETFNRGVDRLQQGDRAGAIEYYELAHRVFQGRPEAMLNLAEQYGNEQRLDEAEDLYRQSVELMTGPRAEDIDEEMAEQWVEFIDLAQFNRAQILYRLERYSEAIGVYEQVLERDPDNLGALSNMAVALGAAGETERAAEIYDDLIDQPGLDAADYFMIGVGLYQAEEFEQAARAFNESWELLPNHREAGFNYAQSLYLLEAWDELISMSDRLIQIDPNNQLAYRFRAQAMAETEQEEGAIETIERMEALPLFVDGTQLQPVEGGVAVTGFVVNRTLDPGANVSLRIHFYDIDGNSAGSADADVEVGEPGDRAQFQAALQTDQPVFGYRYEVR